LSDRPGAPRADGTIFFVYRHSTRDSPITWLRVCV
jgi:hypothetical protein